MQFLGFWRCCLLAALLAGLILSTGAQADSKSETPRDLTRLIADQIMTNKLEPALYGQELLHKLTADRNSAGPLKELLALGPILKVTEVDKKALPGGHVYTMVVKHEHGLSAWFVGLATKTKLVEYVSFNAGNAPAKPAAAPTPAASPAPGPANRPAAPAKPAQSPVDAGTACQKYPNLC